MKCYKGKNYELTTTDPTEEKLNSNFTLERI